MVRVGIGVNNERLLKQCHADDFLRDGEACGQTRRFDAIEGNESGTMDGDHKVVDGLVVVVDCFWSEPSIGRA